MTPENNPTTVVDAPTEETKALTLTEQCKALPVKVTESKHHAMLLLAWASLFSVFSGKSAQAFARLGDWIADDMEFAELALDRVAVRKLVSGWASKLKGKQKRFLELMPRKLGMVLNPYAIHPKHPAQGDKPALLVHEVQMAKLWKALKSEVSLKLNASNDIQAPTGRKDANDIPLAPIALDLSKIVWTDDYNARCENVYKLFVPSASDPVATSNEDIASAWDI